MGAQARADAELAGERAIDAGVQRGAFRRNLQRMGLNNPAGLALYGPVAPLITAANVAAQPFRNMISDPARRQNVADSTQGFVEDVQSVPNLDWGRVGAETAQSVGQGVQNLPRTAANVVTHLPEIGRAMTYGPLVDEEAAQQQLDRARLAGDQEGVSAAAGAANESTVLSGLNLAGPALFARPMTIARAAGTAAALDAPFALSRNSDQPLQERLPGALTEIGGSGAFGGGLQATINAGPVLSRILPSRGAQMVQRMDRAGASVDAQGAPQTPRGVTPSLASANSSDRALALTTNAVADNMLAGFPSRRRLQTASQEVRDAAHDISAAYGRAQSNEGAGRRIQEGIERYAGERGLANPQPGTNPLRVPTRDWSFSSKAEAVYDQVLRPIETNPGRLNNTLSELQRLSQRADAPEVRAFNADPVLGRLRATVTRLQRRAQNGVPPTLRDLRELRRGVREAQGRMRVGPDTVDNAALRSMEGALTRDMYDAAGSAAQRLQAADQYYARGMERIEGLRRIVDPNNPAATMQQIMRAAAPKTENTRFLAAVRSALPDDEWRVVAASIIDEMGRPLPGAKGYVAEQGFSVERFATNYRNMTPRARRIVFGSRGGQGGQSAATMRQLADDLDNLARVADAQKGVAAGMNNSGSLGHGQNLITAAALVNPGTWAAVVTGAVGLVLTGEMLTNPAFVRWLVSARTRSGAAGGIRGSLDKLRAIAARDPAIYPAVAALEARLQAEQSQNAPDVGGGQASMRQPAEPAYR